MCGCNARDKECTQTLGGETSSKFVIWKTKEKLTTLGTISMVEESNQGLYKVADFGKCSGATTFLTHLGSSSLVCQLSLLSQWKRYNEGRAGKQTTILTPVT